MTSAKQGSSGMTRLQIVGAVVAIIAGLSSLGANIPKVRDFVIGESPIIDYTYLDYDKNGVDCLLTHTSARLARYYPNEPVCHLRLGRVHRAWFILLSNKGQKAVEAVNLKGKAWSGEVGQLGANESAMICAGAQRIGESSPVDAHVESLVIKTSDGRKLNVRGRTMPSASAMGEATKACSPFEGSVPNN